MNREYKYWDKVMSKLEKKVREHKIIWFENLPQQRNLDMLYVKNKITEEQYEEMVKRVNFYKIIRGLGLYRVKQDAKEEFKPFLEKYYFEPSEKRYANGKTFSEIFNN